MLRPRMRIFFILGAALIAILCGLWRFQQFGQIELTGDQAFITQWVIRLAEAERFFPLTGADGGWLQDLMRDGDSVLNIFIRQIYQAQALLFMAVSIAGFAVATALAGPGMETVIAISVAASAAAMWLLALFPLICRDRNGVAGFDACAIGGIALIAACGSSFFNVFSAMGPHNAGVMLLVLSLVVTQRWLTTVRDTGFLLADKPALMLMLLVQWLAIYAHHTNVFLVAPATVAAIALDAGWPLRQRVAVAAKYSAVTLMAFLPAIGLVLAYDDALGGPGNTQTFAGLTGNLVMSSPSVVGDTVAERIVLWLREITSFYSVPGLVLGAVGVIGLAIRDRLVLPAALVLTHFLVGASLQIFTQYDRTAAYVLPLLFLGTSWTVVATLRFAEEQRLRGALRFAGALGLAGMLLAGLIAHTASEARRLSEPSTVRHWGHRVGPPAWRPVIAEIDRTVPDGAVLLPWSYGISHQYRSMTKRPKDAVHVMRPLETLISHRKAGTLPAYISSRGLGIASAGAIYVLLPASPANDAMTAAVEILSDRGGFNLGRNLTVTPLEILTVNRARISDIELRLYRVDRR